MSTLVIVVLAVVVLLVVFFVLTYNALVKSRNKVDEAWSGIDVQLKRRHDLVPNLVETVKAYAAHERQTLESVTAARKEAVAASGPEESERAEAKLTGALGAINALAEAYPQLRAAENFQRLQADLAEIEVESAAFTALRAADRQRHGRAVGAPAALADAGELARRAPAGAGLRAQGRHAGRVRRAHARGRRQPDLPARRDPPPGRSRPARGGRGVSLPAA